MEIKEITDKNIWEDFLSGCEEKTFLQSWHWGEFQEKMGSKAFRLGVFDGEKLLSVALVVKVTAKRGTFLLIQHLIKTDGKILETLLNELKKIGKEEKCDFIRVAPLWERNTENQRVFQSLGFREAPMHANVYEATWKLDLSSSEDELLQAMRKTTRYLIRQAEKNPFIAVEQSESLADLEVYQKLNQEVAKRQNFVGFSDEYLKHEFEVFVADKQTLLFFGGYNRDIAAGALIIFWQDTGFYHQAASLEKFAKYSIPYFLQWEAIKEAKKRGCKWYDFWGFTDPAKYPKHPWAGPTLFKMGFGGQAYDYIKTQDLPLSRKYWLTYIFESLRKIKRGL